MSPDAILADLLRCGIDPVVTPDRRSIVVPAGKLTPEQRTAVVAHKAQLIECLVESADLTSRLLAAAMHRCDHFNDSERARQQMREQVLEIPPHLRQDLLEHFLGKPAPCSSAAPHQSLNPSKGPGT